MQKKCHHEKIITIIALMICSAGLANAGTLTVGTYNIRNADHGDIINGNGSNQRCPVICGLVEFNDFDIFGAQEILHEQLTDMLKLLSEYDYLGVGRDDGQEKGEYAPIFYKREKF